MDNDANPSGKSDEFSTEPSQVLAAVLAWLRGFHTDRERSKAADWAMVVLTLFAVVAAIFSAWLFQAQLTEVRRSFRLDERAWVELEPIKAVLQTSGTTKFFEYELYPKNVGKTVAHGVVMKVILTAFTDLIDPSEIACLERLLEPVGQPEHSAAPAKKLCTDLAGKNFIVPIPKVIAPNATSTGPYDFYFKAEGVQSQVLIGRIDYIDDFEVAHWKTFCFLPSDSGELTSCDTGNDEDKNSD